MPKIIGEGSIDCILPPLLQAFCYFCVLAEDSQHFKMSSCYHTKSNLYFLPCGKEKYYLGFGYTSPLCAAFLPPLTDVSDTARFCNSSALLVLPRSLL